MVDHRGMNALTQQLVAIYARSNADESAISSVSTVFPEQRNAASAGGVMVL